MQHMPSLRTLVLLALATVCLAGCSIDPMERLTEDIKSQDKAVRERAVLTLANLDDDRTVETLVDVLSSDDELYNQAGVALVKKGRAVEEPDPKKPNPVVDEVVKVLNNAHLSQEFRGRAAWVLGEIGDRRAIPALSGASTGALVGEKPAQMVRDVSLDALKKLGAVSDGMTFDFDMGRLRGQLNVLPDPPSLPPAA
jgi:HEAT repeat protein